jgi:glycosyltransferase involved in cell wall biosynthesis
MRDVSILIPARNEEFLVRTIEDILSNIEADTEIIVVLDGAPALSPLPVHERVRVIENKESIGQRAATNQAARLSDAKYLIKTDAHCAFDKGFDRKMIEEMHDDWTMVPTMRNLHVFNWVCEDGHKRYQGPSGPCVECNKPTRKDIVWIPKKSPQSNSYCFDQEPHFQYFNDFCKRPEGKGDITETMSLQGSFFMCTREKYWELGLSDEAFGSWGSQGIEVACKTWLSGGKVMVNHKTWYAHLFRTQGGDFGFPYEQKGSQVDHAKKYAKEMFFDNKWDKQKLPLSWLIEKFWPIPGWTEEARQKIKDWPIQRNLTKGIIYYTDNEIDEGLMKKCQDQILKSGLPIVSSSLKPIDFGINIVINEKRGYLTMAKQILAALEKSTSDIIFFCEHDVLYDSSHFEFIPSKRDVYYYNVNVWRVRATDGFAVKVDDCRQLSGLCGYRETLIKHFKERVRRIETEGFSRKMGFEPGTHTRKERVDELKSDKWNSKGPNYDVRHGKNLTSSRWKPEEFRDKRYTIGWRECTININQ